MRIGIDVDDVLLDTLGSAWLPTFNEKTNSNIQKTDIIEWDISKFIDPKYHEYIYELLYSPEMWEKVKPVNDSQKYLKMLNEDKDIELYIVSATSPLTPNTKWQKFFSYFPFINQNQMILIYDKGLLDLDLMVDDNYNNLRIFDILFAQPHNENHSRLYRLDNWKDIYNEIMERK